MTRDETGNYLAYDAWGRLVEVNDGSAVISAYGYDALNRRITHDDTGLYYSAQWQVVEERDTSSGAVEGQYVWSSVYVDAMVLRERDADPNTSGLEERLYVTHDANFNITSTIGLDGSTWEVIERYVFDPYGERTVLNADWTVDTDGLSDVVFVHGHQGGRHDLAVGLVDFRNRFLDTSLGRWTRQDPLGYVDGANVYVSYIRFGPVNSSDPMGLWGCNAKPPAGPVPRTDGVCCAAAAAAGFDAGDWGGVVCCDGRKVACDWSWKSPPPGGWDPGAQAAVASCITEHELDHLDDVNCGGAIPSLTRPLWANPALGNTTYQECRAYIKEWKCLNKNIGACATAQCHNQLADIIADRMRRIRANCGTYRPSDFW